MVCHWLGHTQNQQLKICFHQINSKRNPKTLSKTKEQTTKLTLGNSKRKRTKTMNEKNEKDEDDTTRLELRWIRGTNWVYLRTERKICKKKRMKKNWKIRLDMNQTIIYMFEESIVLGPWTKICHKKSSA